MRAPAAIIFDIRRYRRRLIFKETPVSWKRYPDTKLEFFGQRSGLQNELLTALWEARRHPKIVRGKSR